MYYHQFNFTDFFYATRFLKNHEVAIYLKLQIHKNKIPNYLIYKWLGIFFVVPPETLFTKTYFIIYWYTMFYVFYRKNIKH